MPGAAFGWRSFLKEKIAQLDEQAASITEKAKETRESSGVKCELCEELAELRIWDVESFAIKRKISVCAKCADSSLPGLQYETRARRATTTGEIGIDLGRIGIIEGTDQAVVIFCEIGGDRRFTMMIPERDAKFLIDALMCRKRAHPMVHQSWVEAFAAVQATVVGISISDLREHVFYAKLHVSRGNLEAKIDIRPADGLVVAIWAKAPIYVSENVLESEGGSPREEDSIPATSSEEFAIAASSKNRLEIDFAGRDKEAVGAVMKYHSALKPPGLKQAQTDSLMLFYERQKELSEEPQRLTLDLETQIVHRKEETETCVVFSQIVADDLIRKSFEVYRNVLPPTLRIHELPMDRVGALATLDLSAFAGCAESSADDFIALSMGILRLSHWGLLVARAKEMVVLSGNQESEIEKYPLSWWQGGLASLAMDLFGWSFDAKRGLLISAWAEFGGANEVVQTNLKAILESFVIFHEIGHFEQHHGDRHRQLKLSGGLRPEDYYKMEYEADKFALDHMLHVTESSSAIGTGLTLLFALFACEPTLLERYPACDEAETHPHPFTRLAWLLRQLFPGDLREQVRYINLAASVVTEVIKELGGVAFTQSGVSEKELALLIRLCVTSKPGVPELRFGEPCNEVIDTEFREIDAMKRAARRSKARR